MATAFTARAGRARIIRRRGFGAQAAVTASTAVTDSVERPTPAVDRRFVLYLMLHVLGLAATTLLMTWGTLVLFFVLLGGFSTDGMMLQLDNMASRYVDADPARVASFKQTLAWSQFLLFSAILFFRRHRILPAKLPQAEQAHD